jgi:hypothetical protein
MVSFSQVCSGSLGPVQDSVQSSPDEPSELLGQKRSPLIPRTWKAADAGSIAAASTSGFKPKMDRGNRYIPRYWKRQKRDEGHPRVPAVGALSKYLPNSYGEVTAR